MSLNKLERRIIDLSFKNRLTHVSSCLNVVNALAEIYSARKQDEPVVLGAGHASLALYITLESHGLCDAQEMIEKHGVHASRDMANGVWCSNGALGQAETVACGMALADRGRTVWLVTSDGACAEGAVWEAFNLAAKLRLMNLRVKIIANGLGAYGSIDISRLGEQLIASLYPVPFVIHKPVMPFAWLEGLNGHYLQISDAQHAEAMAA